jgi:predicted transcriptional regulator
MGAHMTKTTIDLQDDLARKAKLLAARRGTTLRALIEQGLRQVLRDERNTGAFVLRDASVAGRGLQPEFRNKDWAALRDAAYEGRGN